MKSAGVRQLSNSKNSIFCISTHQTITCLPTSGVPPNGALKQSDAAASSAPTRGLGRFVMRRNAFAATWQGELQTRGHHGAEYSSVGLIGGSGVGFTPGTVGI